MTEPKTYWVPFAGGYTHYHGPRRGLRGLCFVTRVSQITRETPIHDIWIRLRTLGDHGTEFECRIGDVHEAAVLVIQTEWEAYCSHCGNRTADVSVAMSCRQCHERFIAVCDDADGLFVNPAEIRKSWPLKVITHRQMQLSVGHFLMRPRPQFNPAA